MPQPKVKKDYPRIVVKYMIVVIKTWDHGHATSLSSPYYWEHNMSFERAANSLRRLRSMGWKVFRVRQDTVHDMGISVRCKECERDSRRMRKLVEVMYSEMESVGP